MSMTDVQVKNIMQAIYSQALADERKAVDVRLQNRRDDVWKDISRALKQRICTRVGIIAALNDLKGGDIISAATVKRIQEDYLKVQDLKNDALLDPLEEELFVEMHINERIEDAKQRIGEAKRRTQTASAAVFPSLSSARAPRPQEEQLSALPPGAGRAPQSAGAPQQQPQGGQAAAQAGAPQQQPQGGQAAAQAGAPQQQPQGGQAAAQAGAPQPQQPQQGGQAAAQARAPQQPPQGGQAAAQAGAPQQPQGGQAAGITPEQADHIIMTVISRHNQLHPGALPDPTSLTWSKLRHELKQESYTKEGIGRAIDQLYRQVGAQQIAPNQRDFREYIALNHMPRNPNSPADIDQHLFAQYATASTYKDLQKQMKQFKFSEGDDVKTADVINIVNANRAAEFKRVSADPVGFVRGGAEEQTYNAVKDRRDSILTVLKNYKKKTDELKSSERNVEELRRMSDFVYEQKKNLEKYKNSVESKYGERAPERDQDQNKRDDRMHNVDACLADIRTIEANLTYIEDHPVENQLRVMKPVPLSEREQEVMASKARELKVAAADVSMSRENALAIANAYVGAGGPAVIGFGAHRGDIPEDAKELKRGEARCTARKYVDHTGKLIRIAAVEERGAAYVRSQFVFAVEPPAAGAATGRPIFPFEDENPFIEKRRFKANIEIPGMACLEWGANEIKSIILRSPPAIQSAPIILPEEGIAPRMVNAMRLYCEYKKIPYEPKDSALTDDHHALFEKKYSEKHPDDLSAKALEKKESESNRPKGLFSR